MKSSTPEAPLILQTPSFLFLGPPGSHKTTLALQFPSPYVIDCDENLVGPSKFLREGISSQKIKPLRPDLSFKYDSARESATGKAVPLEDLWARYMTLFEDAVADPSIKTIITDSLTGLDEFNVQKTAQEAGGILKLDRQHWIPFRSRMKTLTIRMRQTGKLNIVCCHQEKTTDQKTGVVTHYDVTMSSRLSDHFGWVFTDVYRFKPNPPIAQNIGGEIIQQARASTLQVTSDSLCDCKNSYGMPPEVPATWAELNKYLKLS